MRGVAVGFIAALSPVLMFAAPTRSLTTALPQNLGDPPFLVWTLRWIGHAFTLPPRRWLDINGFWPERRVLTYSDPLVLQAAPFHLGRAFTGNDVLAYNLVVLLSFAIAVWGGYSLGMRLLARFDAAMVCAVAFAFTGYAVNQLGHLALLSHGLLAFGASCLVGVLRAPSTAGAVRLGLLTAAIGLASLYYAVVWVFVAPVIALVWLLRRAGPEGDPAADAARTPGMVLRALGLAAVIASVVLAPLAVTYVRSSRGIDRPVEAAYPFGWRPADLLTAPRGSLWRTVTGREDETPAGEHVFFPGLTVMALAVLGARRLGRTGTGARRETAGVLAAGAVTLALSAGPARGRWPSPFEIAHAGLPVFDGVRAASRLAVFAFLGLAVLAGGGTAVVVDWMRSRSWRRPLWLLVPALVMIELIAPWKPAPLPKDGDLDRLYDALQERPRAPAVVLPILPIAGPNGIATETLRMLRSVEGWKPLVNGYSGGEPAGYRARVEVLSTLPASEGWREAARLGLRYVIVTEPARASRIAREAPQHARLDRFGPYLLIDLQPPKNAATVPAARLAAADALARREPPSEDGVATLRGWARVNFADDVVLRAVTEDVARATTVTWGASVALDSGRSTAASQRFRASVRARSANDAAIPVRVALWTFCDKPATSFHTFTLTRRWRTISLEAVVPRAGCDLRTELYIEGDANPWLPASIEFETASGRPQRTDGP